MTYLLLIIAGIFIDQFTKYIALLEIRTKMQIPIIPGVFSLYYTENTGMAFSAFSNHTEILVAVTAVSMALLLIILLRNLKNDAFVGKLSICMMLTGGLSNAFDRIVRGYVIDFLYIDLINFPVFNFADILITVGAALFVVSVLFFDEDLRL